MIVCFYLFLLPFWYCRFDLKPCTEKNKLFSEYGTNFRYVGEIKKCLDRVSVVNLPPS